MVVQNPFGMGYDSVKYVFAKLNGDAATVAEMFPKDGGTGRQYPRHRLEIVVPDADSPLTTEMFREFGPAVEFLKLRIQGVAEEIQPDELIAV